MNRQYYFIILLILAYFVISLNAKAGKLDDARDATDSSSSYSTSSSSSSDSDDDSSSFFDSDDSDCSDDEECGEEGVIVLYALTSPFSLPHFLLEGDSQTKANKGPLYFGPKPYSRGLRRPTYINFGSREESETDSLQNLEKTNTSTSFRISPEYSYDFDGVHRPAIYAHFDTSFRIGLQTGWSTFIEPDPDGNGNTDNTVSTKPDYFTIGDLNLTIRFAQSRHIWFYAGAGARILIDPKGENRGGFNFTYGVEILPVKPLTISASIDLGNLGSAFLFHARLRIGAAIGRFEPYIGCDFMSINDVEFKGPVGGIRLWF